MGSYGRELSREEIQPYVEKLCVNFGKVLTRFVADMILGIARSRSVRLTEIARALDENISLHATHKRLSRNLADPAIGSIGARVREFASHRVGDQSLMMLRRTRLQKKYARKLEYINFTGPESPGEPSDAMLWELTAWDRVSSKVTPLDQTLWSSNAYRIPEDRAIHDLLARTGTFVGDRVLLLAGRGCDRPDLLLPWTMDPNRRYLVRQRPESCLMYRRSLRSVSELCELCETPYGKSIYKYVQGTGLDTFLHFGFLPVRLAEHQDRPLALLVVKSGQDGPAHALLTTEPLRRNRDLLFDLAKTYFMSYELVRESRGLMWEFDIGDIRVHSFARLKNLLVLAMATSFYSTVMTDLTVSDPFLGFHRRDAPPA